MGALILANFLFTISLTIEVRKDYFSDFVSKKNLIDLAENR